MAWALMLAAPVITLGFGYSWAGVSLPGSAGPWWALGFLALVSQFAAFWLWYHALARGVARASQLQLLQPFCTLLLATILLGEPLATAPWLHAALVVPAVCLARATTFIPEENRP